MKLTPTFIAVLLRSTLLCAGLYIFITFFDVTGNIIDARVVSGTIGMRQILRDIEAYKHVFGKFPRYLKNLENYEIYERQINNLELVYYSSSDSQQYILTSSILDRRISEKLRADDIRSTYPYYMVILVGITIIIEIVLKQFKLSVCSTKREKFNTYFRRIYFIFATFLIAAFIFLTIFQSIS